MATTNNTVELYYKKKSSGSAYKTECECWITMVEQLLLNDFSNYSVTVDHGPYDRGTKIVIEFDSAEDAAWFRLKQE
jgi:hypothetical protein